MKSFIIVENTSEKSVCKEGNLDFVPAFPGIFIDLDKEVDNENCDHYLGTAGLGCEYHIKDGQIKKMFLEMLPHDLVEFVPENIVEIIQKQLKKEVVTHELISFKIKAECFSAKKIILNEAFNLIQFFFSTPITGITLQESIESFNYLKVSSNVAFGLTEKNEFVSIIVTEFAKRFYNNDFILENTIDGSSKRFNNFVKLNQQFYDKNIDGKDFEALVSNYFKKYNLLNEKTIGFISEADILNTLVKEKKWRHKLLKK